MADFESKIIHPLINHTSMAYFSLGKEQLLELIECLKKINKNYQTINFDQEYLKAKIQFSDIFLCNDYKKYLETTINRKPTVVCYVMENEWLKNESNDFLTYKCFRINQISLKDTN